MSGGQARPASAAARHAAQARLTESLDDHGIADSPVVRLVGAAPADAENAAERGVDPDAYRRVFRRHAAGVTVVTLEGASGPVGFTATSVASLSLEPPLISLSVASTSSSWPSLLVADTVVVHLLSDSQRDLAHRFAIKGIDRFAAPTRWTRLPTGEPLLAEAPAWVRARLEHRVATGDHRLLVARVLQAHTGDDVTPLIYHDGRYGTFLENDAR
ncbi:flavin reductase family protein [Protofrankia sp. BMG5.30]|uniref:flavin reductase family protein n=1 Tax=Protofrankia sp. BMG5.30 TaxID=1834514 RepID=UPI0009FB0EA4|nr:flavin reductase family protein [Protofrankia sp. BMG5.30]